MHGDAFVTISWNEIKLIQRKKVSDVRFMWCFTTMSDLLTVPVRYLYVCCISVLDPQISIHTSLKWYNVTIDCKLACRRPQVGSCECLIWQSPDQQYCSRPRRTSAVPISTTQALPSQACLASWPPIWLATWPTTSWHWWATKITTHDVIFFFSSFCTVALFHLRM